MSKLGHCDPLVHKGLKNRKFSLVIHMPVDFIMC